MKPTQGQPVLVAEPTPSHARHLRSLLQQMRYRVCLATDCREAIDVLRREAPAHAIVAVELATNGEPLLAGLARLPALDHLIGTGPGGEPASEITARRAGATAYLARPISAGPLAAALTAPRGRYEPVHNTVKGAGRCPEETWNE